jgi:CheY-like chemotaxis protein
MESIENSNYTVLVVDDDNDLNSMLQEALSEEGFNVLTNNSGLKGLDTLRYGSENVDVVLLDYSMPVLDGGQTLEHLNQHFPNVKTIGVTGLGASQLSDAYRNGVQQLVMKPVNVGDLVTAIHSVLGIAVPDEAAARRSHWIKFSLWYVFFLLCSYEFLKILGQMVNEALFVK